MMSSPIPFTDAEQKKLPAHVAIIMDGNGRWAKKHAVKVALGHRQGVEALRDIIRFSSDIGIQALSLYAFSNENWSRSQEEVHALMQLLLRFFSSEIEELDQNQVHIRIIGDVDGLPLAQRRAVLQAQDQTKHNTGLKLNIALNYSSQKEIIHAVRALAQKVQQGELSFQDIDESLFEQYLYTAGLPMVDLLIRTSGEMRLSNFLLYQNTYAEFAFPTVLWPDFTKEDYVTILKDFPSRQRRFGARLE